MSHDIFWTVLRMINLVILFVAFMVMIYKGVFKLTMSRQSFQWDRMMNLVWVTILIFSISELLVSGEPGGFRTFLTIGAAALQLYVAVFGFKMREDIVDE